MKLLNTTLLYPVRQGFLLLEASRTEHHSIRIRVAWSGFWHDSPVSGPFISIYINCQPSKQICSFWLLFPQLIFDFIFYVIVLGKSFMFINHLGWCIMLWKKYNMRVMLRSHKAETLKKCLMTLDNAWGCLMMTLDDIKLHSIMDRKTDGQ